MASMFEQLQSLTTNVAAQADCYLLSMPKEVRYLIWSELLLRQYALHVTTPRGKPDFRVYGGREESSMVRFKGQRFLARTSDEIFDPETCCVQDVHGSLSTTVAAKSKEECSNRRAIKGLEILRACKQICEEGLDVLYGENTFCLSAHWHIEYIHHWRKWMQPTRVKGGSTMWSTDTLTALSKLFKPSQIPEVLFLNQFQLLLQVVSKKNTARITKVHFRVFLTHFGQRMCGLCKPVDVSGFIKEHNFIFNKSLSGLKELRMAGYWDDTLGKRAIARNRIWQNYSINRQDPTDFLSEQRVFKITKNIETFVKLMPRNKTGHANRNSSSYTKPVLWLDIIELRKMNERRAEIAASTSLDKAALTLHKDAEAALKALQ